MIILPSAVIEDRVQAIRYGVMKDVLLVFILPFGLFSLAMMMVISCILNKISISIT